MAVKVFRWRAIGPLLGFAALGVAGWTLFADRIARATAEDVGTSVVGARVEIRDLHIDLAAGDVTVRGLTVASPHEPFKNLLEADELVADLDVLPLLEKKVVIDRLAAQGLRFGTPRTTDGRVGGRADGGMAGRALAEAKTWAQQFQVPALQLATGKIDIGTLDPARLSTLREVDALAARADSSRRAWNAALEGLPVSATIDSTNAMIRRLRGAKPPPADLALLNDARRTLDQVKRTRDRLTALERGVSGGVAALRAGLAALDQAKQRDYAFARGLVKLPSLDAPEVGAALFAPAAIARFERALYWAELARRHMPSGLLPRADAGPQRARASGTTVRFPRERAYPSFLLRSAELSFLLDPTSPQPRLYTGRLAGLTSAPKLYGRPATFEATAPAVRVAALLDHVGDTPRDTAAATLAGVRLPDFALPSLPVRVAPGKGTMALSFALTGERIRARWGVRSDAVRWTRDSAAAAKSPLEEIVWRVLSGMHDLDIVAEVSGSLAAPRLAVRSNFDRALAERLRAVVGEEVAAAERKLRAEVDRLVEEKAAPVRAQVSSLTGEVSGRIAEQRAQLDKAHKDLERRLRELTGGIRLPG